MSLSDLASLGSFVSGFAVLVSLVFLYFQLNQVRRQIAQAERNQQASLHFQRSTRGVETALRTTEPHLAEALVNAFSGGDLSEAQYVQCQGFVTALFLAYEDSFWQHEHGLVSDDAFAGMVTSIASRLRIPSFRVLWKRLMSAEAGSASFKTFLERQLEQIAVRSYSGSPLERFKAEVAAESQKAA